MKKIFIYLTIFAGITACSDLLEKTDLSGVDEKIWDNEATATLNLNRIYDLAMPVYYSMRSSTTLPVAIHTASDESNLGNTKALYGQITVDDVNDFWGDNNNNAWTTIRKINVLLEGIETGALDDAAKNRIKGQALFLRAWVYFNLVKVYGGVPIITGAQDWVSDDLLVTRSKTSECINFIVGDLDQAAALLAPGMPATQGVDRGRATKDTALALKGRVLLYWASPQFNATNDGARWELAYQANRVAYDTLVKHGYALYPKFADILTDEGTTNRETIMIRSYDGTNRPNTFENGSRPFSESANGGGGAQPTWELVKAFPMQDGTPSMVNGVAANGFDTLYYWKNRDPRFAATIAYNGSVWELSGKTGRKQWNYVKVIDDNGKQTATGFYNRKGVNTKTTAVNAPLGTTDWVEMRLAEVMLNLAECANATDRIQEAYAMLTAIRQRAGIVNNNNYYGLDPAMDKATMFTAIMNERQIELAFEGKRYDDLRRTKTFDQLNGKRRHALQITANNIKALEQTDANGVRLREKIDINGPDYVTHFKPSYVSLDTQFPILFKPEYNFYGIPTTNLLRNTNLLQNPSWGSEGNVFNPLE